MKKENNTNSTKQSKKSNKVNTYLAVDLKTITHEKMAVNRPTAGTLVMDEQNEHFTFRQKGTGTVHPECHWHLIERTKHGKASINGRHMKVEFYILHEEYPNGRALSDILTREIEQMSDQTFETAGFDQLISDLME